MIPTNLKFQYDPADRNRTKYVLKQDIRAFGLTAYGFEILHHDPQGDGPKSECVHVVRGTNLDMVWDDLVFNRIDTFVARSVLVPSAFAHVTEIRPEKRWSDWVATVPPEQNAPRRDCLQFEASSFRHLWPLAHLEAFLLQDGRLAFQFRGDHSYILTPAPDKFAEVRDRVLDENLRPGCGNLFTVFDDSWYVDAAPDRFVCQTILHKQENIAARGEWEVVLDLRWTPKQTRRPRISPKIDL